MRFLDIIPVFLLSMASKDVKTSFQLYLLKSVMYFIVNPAII